MTKMRIPKEEKMKELLDLLGLWFAYYYDKMIGHAKELDQLVVESIMVTS